MSTLGGGKAESVFLSGISNNIKKNGISFQREFSKALPQIKISQVNFTRSGCVILSPATPEDFSRLMKEDWSKHVSLGLNITASISKSKKVEYKAVVTGVDPDLDDDELKNEMEERNQLKVTSIARLLHKGTKTKTYKVMVCFENEETQKRVIRNGLFLGFQRHKCEAAIDKPRHGSADININQCFRCQKWDPDHTRVCSRLRSLSRE